MEFYRVHCFKTELRCRNVSFWGGRKTGEAKETLAPETRTSNKRKPLVTLSPGRGTQQSFLQGGSAQTPIPLYNIFDREGTPFHKPSIENCTPFIYLQSDFYQTFHSRNPLKYLD